MRPNHTHLKVPNLLTEGAPEPIRTEVRPNVAATECARPIRSEGAPEVTPVRAHPICPPSLRCVARRRLGQRACPICSSKITFRKHHTPNGLVRLRAARSLHSATTHPRGGAYLTNRNRVARRHDADIKRVGKVWIKSSRRPCKSRPRPEWVSGKGSPEWWIANIKPGRVLFELSGVNEDIAREAMRLAIHKLPMKARFIKREAGEI